MHFCEICGHPADRHHIVSRGAGGRDEPFNILLLCRAHHREYHDVGWTLFLDRHPRLTAKVLTARDMAGKHMDVRVT